MTARKVSMRRGLRVTGLALLAAATLEPSATAEEQFQKLTGGQIRAKLAGMELTDNVHWRDLYQRNGTGMSTSMGRKTYRPEKPRSENVSPATTSARRRRTSWVPSSMALTAGKRARPKATLIATATRTPALCGVRRVSRNT